MNLGTLKKEFPQLEWNGDKHRYYAWMGTPQQIGCRYFVCYTDDIGIICGYAGSSNKELEITVTIDEAKKIYNKYISLKNFK